MPTQNIKKTTARSSKSKTRAIQAKPVVEIPVVADELPTRLPLLKLDNKILFMIVVLVGVGALTYKVAPWLIPAIVDKTPVTRWEVYERMEKNYGAQILDDMVNEKILDKAIEKSGVVVDKVDVDAQLAKIEEQFKTMGGLDEALKSRGLSRQDLTKQVTTQLAVEKILKDKIMPTDEEVQKYFNENGKTLFADKKLDEVKQEIISTLGQSKLQEQFVTWFAEAKKGVTVRNYVAPTIAPVPQQ